MSFIPITITDHFYNFYVLFGTFIILSVMFPNSTIGINNILNYYLDAILNCDSMGKYELLIGLEVIPAGIPRPWYRAILTGFSVSSVIAFFTLFSLVWNVALRHNQVWQCDSIATLKFNDVSANFWVAILLHCQTLLWRNATFQTKQKVSSQVINGILTVCESARRKYKALGQCTGLASFDRHYQPRALYFSVQNHKQSVSRYYCQWVYTVDVNVNHE